MAKQHKLANARIEIDSGLPPERVLEVARHATGTQKSLKIVGEGEGGIRVALSGLLGGALMNFVVTAEPEGARTRVVSAIEEYRTSQTTVYFIPVGPKSMEGIGIYRRFMTTFGQAMQAADPSARIQMIEREDRAPAVSAPGVAYDAAAAPGPARTAPAVPMPPAGSGATVALPAVPDVAAAVPAAIAAPVANSAPQSATPTALSGFSNPHGGVSTPAGISESTSRVVQIAGGAVVAGGLIFWYATPGNVVVGPLLVVLLGAVTAGVGFLLGRRANSAASDELATKLRQERALNAAAMPASPVPASFVAYGGVPPSGIPPIPLPAPTMAAAPVDQRPQVSSGPSVGPISSIPGLSSPVQSAPPLPKASALGAVVAAPVPLPVPVLDVWGEDDLDSTRVAVPARAAWLLVLADGRSIPVPPLLRLGRDPVADPVEPGSLLVPLVDPAKSVSKTHAEVRVITSGLSITDLHSTNGTLVVIDGVPTQVAPERPCQVTGGAAELRLGDYAIQIRRV